MSLNDSAENYNHDPKLFLNALKRKSKQRAKSKKKQKKKTTPDTVDGIKTIETRTPTKGSTSNVHKQPVDAESDCEIIENIAPLIVLDDDSPSEPVIESTVESIETDSTKATKTAVEVEPKPLFFVDNTPSTDFSPPIYDIDSEVNPNQIMSQVRNIRISGPVSFTNKENRVTLEPNFAPDPMLSSTRLNESLEEDDNISVDHVVSMPPAIHISIDSSCETGASRKITVDRPSSKPSSPKPTTTTEYNNNNNKPVDVPRANKRKADNSADNEQPPQKKNASDVIVLNDTILDVDHVEDDSVVFVSETMLPQKPDEILTRPNKQKAADYIPINGNSSERKTVSISNVFIDEMNWKPSMSELSNICIVFEIKIATVHSSPTTIGKNTLRKRTCRTSKTSTAAYKS